MKTYGKGFLSIRIEGGLFPAEFLQKIAELGVSRQAAADYGLSRNLNLKDEIGRYWRIARGEWQDYQSRINRPELNAHKVGIEQWLVRLCKHVLGYEDLTPCAPVARADRLFPVNHLAFGGAVPFVLTTHTFGLEKPDQLFGDESRKRSPHALMQEFLNAEEGSLWGLVSNGTHLRLLRDNPSLTRPAFIEVDFARMFDEELFADFAAFWLIFHASRLAPHEGSVHRSIIETWRENAHQIGERALENLRNGVAEALRKLGTGFLQHPSGADLRRRLERRELTPQAYYSELLRLVYRFLFLFTAEERNLLLLPGTPDSVRRLYESGYSLQRIRERSLKRRNYDSHSDLWYGLQITFKALSRGLPELGLPGLGGLFGEDQCPNVMAAGISNEYLLQAVHSLSFFKTGVTLAVINYRDMGTEELGSVYESLLELHPQIEQPATGWVFRFLGDEGEGRGSGSERKLSGSYYTPPSLVHELIKSTLEPVIQHTIKAHPAVTRQALLKLRIIDPACGSGHFLLAAARRLAIEIALLESTGDLPDEEVRRHAMREVVQHCIFGVDRNPLSVELCRTALWIETLEPGKPLSFLDSHIQCGDSLVGVFNPSALDDGIPDKAYTALSGDSSELCSSLKKQNQDGRKQRESGNPMNQQLTFASIGVAREVSQSADGTFEDLPEETLEQINQKKQLWQTMGANQKVRREQLRADLYCGAFFAAKIEHNRDLVPLTEDLSRIENEKTMRPGVEAFAAELSRRYQFFHWHIAFMSIMQNGGFDVVLGNPPWERIKLQEQEFFAARSIEIANAPNKAARERLIQRLNSPSATPPDRALYQEYIDAKRESEASSLFVRNCGRFPLTAVGDVNTYALFAEHFARLYRDSGRAGFIVPTGIATDDSTKKFFDFLTSDHRLVKLLDFENRDAIFPGVHRSYKFALLTLGRNVPETSFVFFATNTEQVTDKRRAFTLSADDIGLINPNTRTCPVFRSSVDAELTKKIYRRVPVLINESAGESGNPWGISFMAMFHMANDSGLFKTYAELSTMPGLELVGNRFIKKNCPNPKPEDIWLPLYEAKMIHQFDHRWATYETDGETLRDCTIAEKSDPDYQPLPRYWVPAEQVESRLAAKNWPHQWLMGWRDICRSTDERTVIASIFPKAGCGDTLLLKFPSGFEPVNYIALNASLDSLVCDYVARQKIGGTHLKYHVFKQIAVLPPSAYTKADLGFIVPRALELIYTSHELQPFAADLGFNNPPFPFKLEERAFVRAELDAYYAYLYGLTRDELRYVLDPTDVYGDDFPSETFRVLKNNEICEFGEYRTRRLVLEAFDRFTSDGTFTRRPETTLVLSTSPRPSASEPKQPASKKSPPLPKPTKPRAKTSIPHPTFDFDAPEPMSHPSSFASDAHSHHTEPGRSTESSGADSIDARVETKTGFTPKPPDASESAFCSEPMPSASPDSEPTSRKPRRRLVPDPSVAARPDVVVRLPDEMADYLRKREVKGTGGFQSLIRMLKQHLTGSTLSVPAVQFERLKRYAAGYGQGGFQDFIKRLITLAEGD